jgi:hypothetical protein
VDLIPYAVPGFLLITAVDLWFESHAVNMPFVIRAAFVALLIYTLVVLGAMLVGKPWALALEIGRWFAIAATLGGAFMTGLLPGQLCLAGLFYLVASAPLMLLSAKSMEADSMRGWQRHPDGIV